MAGSSISCWQMSSALKEVRDLRRVMDSLIGAKKCDEAFEIKEQIFNKINEIKEVLYFTTLERAKEILGEDVIDPKELERVLGHEIKTIPKISFSEAILKRSKDYGMRLLLRVPEDEDMEMMSIYSLFMKYINNHECGLYNPGLMRKEVTDSRVGFEWVLVSKELITEDTFKSFDPTERGELDYEHETNQIAGLVNDFYFVDGYHGIDIPEGMMSVLQDWNGEKNDLLKDVSRNAQGQKLVNMAINQVVRHSPAEMVYDWLVISKLRDENWLQGKDVWTNVAYSQDNKVVSIKLDKDDKGVARPAIRLYSHDVVFSESIGLGSLFMLRGDDEIKKKLKNLREEEEDGGE